MNEEKRAEFTFSGFFMRYFVTFLDYNWVQQIEEKCAPLYSWWKSYFFQLFDNHTFYDVTESHILEFRKIITEKNNDVPQQDWVHISFK